MEEIKIMERIRRGGEDEKEIEDREEKYSSKDKKLKGMICKSWSQCSSLREQKKRNQA